MMVVFSGLFGCSAPCVRVNDGKSLYGNEAKVWRAEESSQTAGSQEGGAPRTERTLNSAPSIAPFWPRTRGTPVEFALGSVELYAASVKLFAMSNAPGPSPWHQEPWDWRAPSGDASAPRASGRRASAGASMATNKVRSVS